MKYYLILIAVSFSFTSLSQKTKEETIQYRITHSNHLTDTSSHLLRPEEIETFQGLDYFDFDTTYQIKGTFKKKTGRRFKMPTSTDRKPVYRRFGYVTFEMNGETHTLEVYQSIVLRKEKSLKDHLFIPFRDATSSHATYGGGRYLDILIPKGTTLLLDFNQAYNPYCAYSTRYSCPIPPAANTLSIPINAGEKTPLGH